MYKYFKENAKNIVVITFVCFLLFEAAGIMAYDGRYGAIGLLFLLTSFLALIFEAMLD